MSSAGSAHTRPRRLGDHFIPDRQNLLFASILRRRFGPRETGPVRHRAKNSSPGGSSLPRRRRRGGKGRGRTGKPAANPQDREKEKSRSSKPKAAEPSRQRPDQRPDQRPGDDKRGKDTSGQGQGKGKGPVKGMGDHVPAFLQAQPPKGDRKKG